MRSTDALGFVNLSRCLVHQQSLSLGLLLRRLPHQHLITPSSHTPLAGGSRLLHCFVFLSPVEIREGMTIYELDLPARNEPSDVSAKYGKVVFEEAWYVLVNGSCLVLTTKSTSPAILSPRSQKGGPKYREKQETHHSCVCFGVSPGESAVVHTRHWRTIYRKESPNHSPTWNVF